MSTMLLLSGRRSYLRLTSIVTGVILACGLLYLTMGSSLGTRSSVQQKRKPVDVAIFSGHGKNDRGVTILLAALEEGGECHCDVLSPQDIRGGALRHDVIVVPGGMASEHYDLLGSDGRKAIISHVADGGGYVGICAGAYFAFSDPKQGLGLLDVTPLSGSQEIPGWGEVAVAPRRAGPVLAELTDHGKEWFPNEPFSAMVQFRGGPIIPVDHIKPSASLLILATFKSEQWSYEFQRNTMLGTPAIISGRFGLGQVIAISPHAEESADWKSLTKRAVVLTSRSSTAISQ